MPRPDYSAIDQYALSVPKSEESTIAGLTAYLIKPAKNDAEKARAIYRWITNSITYNVQEFLSGTQSDQSPATVFIRRTAVCQGFAELFEAMAKLAGLSAVFVGGLSRDSFDKTINHAWNAVKIDGKWALVDSTFGNGYMDENNAFIRDFDEFYFLTPPEQLIYTNFPEDSQWQLLPTPLTREAFDALPLVTSVFFLNGLQIGNYQQGIITVSSDVSVNITAPPDVMLMAKLMQGQNTLPQELTFSQRENGAYSIDVVFPYPGDCTLMIFVKKKADPGNEYLQALDYLVKVSQGAGGLPVGFPKTYQDFSQTDAYLYSPKSGNLVSGTVQTFKLDVPGANEVDVIVNNQDWHKLTKQGQTFEGQFTVAKGEILVVAGYPNETNFRVLLAYNGL